MLREYIQKYRTVLIVVLVVCCISIPLYTLTRSNDIDQPVIGDGITPDYSKMAVVKNGGKLFSSIGDFKRYDLLLSDIYVFGRLSYEPYTTNQVKYVGFQVSDKSIKKENETVSFTGRYGSSSNNITVRVKILTNGVISTSITDTKTNKNIDSDLPSNSKRNQFISTLPVSQDDFVVNYDSTTDSFSIASYFGSKDSEANIKSFLEKSLGINDLSTEDYTIYELFGADNNNDSDTPL